MTEATMLYCPASNGPRGGDNTTHHLTRMRFGNHYVQACRYCHRTRQEIEANESAGDAHATVTTWADGAGRWHAKVTLPNGSGTPEFKARARAAMRTEMARTDVKVSLYVIMLVELARHADTAHNTTTVHYREKD